MRSIPKSYFEEILASASKGIIREFSREEAEELINRYFPKKEYLSKQEASEMLGCSVRQIDNLRETQNLPWIQQGCSVKFCIHDLREWMELHRKQGPNSVPSVSYNAKEH